MKKRIIYYHPLELKAGQASGSRVRPYEFLQAFKEKFDVDVVNGSREERSKAIRNIKSNIRNGQKYEFCYIEPLTSPILFLNFRERTLYSDHFFFLWLAIKRIPVGLFYRDIYWKFKGYRDEIGLFKATLGRILYYLDSVLMYFYLKVVFLPHLRMQKYLPWLLRIKKCVQLPPATKPMDLSPVPFSGKIRLLYVGGVVPPFYDLGDYLGVFKNDDRFSITICCREEEWQRVKKNYEGFNNLQVVHQSGDQLRALYENNDISLILRTPHPYQHFAMPIKLFEAIQHHKPIIASKSTAFGDFVEDHGIGWTVSGHEDLKALRDGLGGEAIAVCSESASQLAERNTWLARTESVEASFRV